MILLAIAGRFPLGVLLCTPGAEKEVPQEEITQALARHTSGEWGDLDDEDKRANDRALANGSRLLSAFTTRSGTKFWVITEWDRSATTVLLPHEY